MNWPSAQDLRAKLNSETGKLDWPVLARYFARGAVIKVAQGVDLVDVAAHMAVDDKRVVEQWFNEGKLVRASTADGVDWNSRQPTFWAVVVAPWVLVQEESDRPRDS